MLTLYKIALGPVLLLQGRRVRKTALRLPEAAGPRTGATSAARESAPLRILFVGDSSIAGVGVEHQEHALAPQASALLAARLGTKVQWQIVARSGITTREAQDLVAASELAPADLLVVSLGTNDVTGQRPVAQFLNDYEALMANIVSRAGTRAAIITGIPPLHISPAMPQPLRWYIGQCAFRLDAALRRWAAANRTRSFISLQWAGVAANLASDGYHPGAGQYTHWAQLVAEHAAELFRSGALLPDT